MRFYFLHDFVSRIFSRDATFSTLGDLISSLVSTRGLVKFLDTLAILAVYRTMVEGTSLMSFLNTLSL